MMKVQLPDGSVREVARGTTPYDSCDEHFATAGSSSGRCADSSADYGDHDCNNG